MDISVIIPLYNEDESLTELTAWIEKVMTKHRFSYEIIMIDDGSKDRSWELICRLAEKIPVSGQSDFAGITENLPPCTAVFTPHKAMSSLQWTQTCRTAPTKSRHYTG